MRSRTNRIIRPTGCDTWRFLISVILPSVLFHRRKVKRRSIHHTQNTTASNLLDQITASRDCRISASCFPKVSNFIFEHFTGNLGNDLSRILRNKIITLFDVIGWDKRWWITSTSGFKNENAGSYGCGTGHHYGIHALLTSNGPVVKVTLFGYVDHDFQWFWRHPFSYSAIMS